MGQVSGLQADCQCCEPAQSIFHENLVTAEAKSRLKGADRGIPGFDHVGGNDGPGHGVKLAAVIPVCGLG